MCRPARLLRIDSERFRPLLEARDESSRALATPASIDRGWLRRMQHAGPVTGRILVGVATALRGELETPLTLSQALPTLGHPYLVPSLQACRRDRGRSQRRRYRAALVLDLRRPLGEEDG